MFITDLFLCAIAAQACSQCPKTANTVTEKFILEEEECCPTMHCHKNYRIVYLNPRGSRTPLIEKGYPL